MTSLKTLNLSANKIEDVSPFVEVLKENTTLEKLDLSENHRIDWKKTDPMLLVKALALDNPRAKAKSRARSQESGLSRGLSKVKDSLTRMKNWLMSCVRRNKDQKIKKRDAEDAEESAFFSLNLRDTNLPRDFGERVRKQFGPEVLAMIEI